MSSVTYGGRSCEEPEFRADSDGAGHSVFLVVSNVPQATVPYLLYTTKNTRNTKVECVHAGITTIAKPRSGNFVMDPSFVQDHLVDLFPLEITNHGSVLEIIFSKRK